MSEKYKVYREQVEKALQKFDNDTFEMIREIGEVIDQSYSEPESNDKELEGFKKLNLTEKGQLFKNDPEKYKRLAELSKRNPLL